MGNTTFNVNLPPRFTYDDGKSPEDNFKDLDDYVLALHTSIETILRRLHNSVSDVADSPTEGNIASLDEDGNITDNGIAKDDDGTLSADSDDRLPTQKAVKTYADAVGSTASTALGNQKLNGHVAPDGNVDFNDKQAIDLILENRTDDTGMGVEGQIWIRTDV